MSSSIGTCRGVVRDFIVWKPTKNKWSIYRYLSYLSFQIANKKDTDQTARMRRLVCAFAVCKLQIGFLTLKPMSC